MNNVPSPVPEAKKKSTATGPRTEPGKARASLNAVRHGLAGRHILLPGEDELEYSARLEQIFVALAPENELEAEVAVLVADDLWKLARLERMEKAALLGHIEELLCHTGSADTASALTQAMQALADAITAWEAAPVPNDPTLEFSRRLGLQRRLVLLEQMRKLRTGQPASEQAAQRARDFRVRLRLVH
jgi:hypothetical protein